MLPEAELNADKAPATLETLFATPLLPLLAVLLGSSLRVMVEKMIVLYGLVLPVLVVLFVVAVLVFCSSFLYPPCDQTGHSIIPSFLDLCCVLKVPLQIPTAILLLNAICLIFYFVSRSTYK